MGGPDPATGEEEMTKILYPLLYQVNLSALRPEGRSLLKVDRERAFISALKSRAWACSKGQHAGTEAITVEPKKEAAP
jgi:hypothetical protein